MAIELEDLTVTELKRRLSAAGVTYNDCFEKDDLVRRARQRGIPAAGGGAGAGEKAKESVVKPEAGKPGPHASGPSGSSGPKSPAGGSSSTRNGSAEALVRRVKSSKDYYEILGVSNSCTEDELKKAYRKLALQLHPDKNKAAGAEEAFKKVNKAFDALSDADKRAKYDRYGTEDPMGNGGPGPSPEDIFAQFFGGGVPGGFAARGAGGQQFHFNVDDLFGQFAGAQQSRRRPQQQGERRQQPQNIFQMLNNFSLNNLMPVLPLIFIALPMIIQLITAAVRNLHVLVLMYFVPREHRGKAFVLIMLYFTLFS